MDDRLLVGAHEIASAIGQPVRRVRHWLDRGLLKCASKRGNLWTASRRRLRAECGLD